MIGQVVSALLLVSAYAVFARQAPPPLAPPRPPAQIPLSRLTADATIAVALAPGSVESADAVWVPNRAAGTIVRIDAKDNSVGSPIAAGAEPCASLAVAFDSVWVPLCGDGMVVRADVKTKKVAAPIKLKVASADGRIASGVGSIWAITDRKGVVSRIDPDTNLPVAEIYVAGGAASIVLADETLWITSEDGMLTRVNPHNNQVVEEIKVGQKPGLVAVGEGGVWTLNRGNGSVTRVDPATNKVVATIAIGDDVASGEIAAGLGSVWISAPGMPIVRIDPRTNRAVQRFTGDGGGAVLVAHGSLWVVAGPQVTWRLDAVLVAAMRP